MSEFDFLFTNGQSFTKAEAYLYLLAHPEVMQEESRNNKLYRIWHWSSSKSVARFFEQLHDKGLLLHDQLVYPIIIPVAPVEVKKLHKFPIELVEVDENIYREFKHLKLMRNQSDIILALGYTKEMLDSVLDDIQNSASNSKYVDLFLTAKKWLKKNYPNINQGNLFPEQEDTFKYVSPVKSKK